MSPYDSQAASYESADGTAHGSAHDAPRYPPPEYYHQLAATGVPVTSTPAQQQLPSLEPPASIARVQAAPWMLGLRRLGMLLLTPVSALVSIWAFGLYFGSLRLGVGIVGLIFVHEMGHFIVYKLKGVRVKLPIFIPLLGAFVTSLEVVPKVKDRAEAALAGPVLGGLGAFACLVIAQNTANADCGVSLLDPTGTGLVCISLHGNWPIFWLALANIGFFLNLLNLMPINPLDGGRVAGAISRWLWPLGLAVGGVLLFLSYQSTGTISPIWLIIGFVGLFETISNFQQAPQSEYFAIGFGVRVYITVAYGLTVALLAIGMLETSHIGSLLRLVGS